MHSYAAFIGHQPHVSLAELGAVVPGFVPTRMLEQSVAVFDSSEPLQGSLLDTLGGTVVLAEKLDARSTDDLPQLLLAAAADVKGKVTFSIRTQGLSPREISQLYRVCKDALKKKGRPARYVGSERQAAASVLLRDAGLLDGSHGCELCVLKAKEFLWIGRTIAAQDVDAYTERDMEKPVRDTTVGLLPPKLAQVMLNFGLWLAAPMATQKLDAKKPGAKSQKPTSHFAIYDPFCGTGVIPMEALLRGLPVLASDKSEKAVTGCEKNLEWLRKRKQILKTDVPSAVWKQDATKPFAFPATKIPLPPAGAIVTETSLGPALRKRPTSKEAMSLRAENEKLQEAFLKNVAALLPGVPVVCTWPVWYCAKTPLRLERIREKLGTLGYMTTLPPGIRPAGDDLSLLYRRPGQFVGREIVLLKPRRR